MFQPFASLQLRLAGDRGSFFQSSWFLCTLHTHTSRADPTVSLTGIYSFAWHFSNTLSGHFSRSTLRDWAGGFAASGSVYWWFVRLVGLKHFLARPQPLVTKLFAPPCSGRWLLVVVCWNNFLKIPRRCFSTNGNSGTRNCSRDLYWTMNPLRLPAQRTGERRRSLCTHTHSQTHSYLIHFLKMIQIQLFKKNSTPGRKAASLNMCFVFTGSWGTPLHHHCSRARPYTAGDEQNHFQGVQLQ